MKRAFKAWLAALALALSPQALAHGDAHAGHGAQHPSEPAPGAARVSLKDVTLVDQDGLPRRIASEVIGDRIVVVDFVYTTCTTVCPVVSAIFADVQKRLGPALGGEVALVSITVDPARDTPAALKAYGARHGAKPGWTWLTGTPPNVNAVLKGFGAYVADPTQHPAMVMVGDGRSGAWTRYFGFPSATQIVARVEALRRGRAAAAVTTGGKG